MSKQDFGRLEVLLGGAAPALPGHDRQRACPGVTAAPADDDQIVVAEGPVPDQVGFGHR